MSRLNQNEDSLVQRIARVFAEQQAGGRSTLKEGVGDDAALFVPRRGYETMLTCDWFLEGAHFVRDKHPADAVGWKCLARAVSDIAAMGGQPRCFLLSLALPQTYTGHWLDEFLRGLRRAARKFCCFLAGGRRSAGGASGFTVGGEARRRYFCERAPGRGRTGLATLAQRQGRCE